MKLLLCGKCQDIFKLDFKQRSCKCGKTEGQYLKDGLNAVYSGENAIPLGINNHDLKLKVTKIWRYNWKDKFGVPIEAFIIPTNCPTMKKRGYWDCGICPLSM